MSFSEQAQRARVARELLSRTFSVAEQTVTSEPDLFEQAGKSEHLESPSPTPTICPRSDDLPLL